MLRTQIRKSTVEYKRQQYFRVLKQDPDKYNALLNSDLYDISSMSNRQLNIFFIKDKKIREILDIDVGKMIRKDTKNINWRR